MTPLPESLDQPCEHTANGSYGAGAGGWSKLVLQAEEAVNATIHLKQFQWEMSRGFHTELEGNKTEAWKERGRSDF